MPVCPVTSTIVYIIYKSSMVVWLKDVASPCSNPVITQTQYIILPRLTCNAYLEVLLSCLKITKFSFLRLFLLLLTLFFQLAPSNWVVQSSPAYASHNLVLLALFIIRYQLVPLLGAEWDYFFGRAEVTSMKKFNKICDNFLFNLFIFNIRILLQIMNVKNWECL